MVDSFRNKTPCAQKCKTVWWLFGIIFDVEIDQNRQFGIYNESLLNDLLYIELL